MTLFKKVGVAIGILAVTAVGVSVVFRQDIARIRYQTTLFTGIDQQVHFVSQEKYYPITKMVAPEESYVFPVGESFELPASFAYKGENFTTSQFLKDTDTGALLILKDGKIVYEDYWLTAARDEPWLSHSISKSFVSAAVGLAVQDGYIRSIEDPITDYVPALKDSGYNDVKIKNILQMSSGIRWNEDYSDPKSDMSRLGKTMALGLSYDKLVSKMVAERPQGTYNRYTGMDTQALTFLVGEATGMSLSKYLEENLWKPLGAEYDAFWTTDRKKRELGLGGLNATARDFAKFGELYRLQGNWQGKQILSADWVKASTTPDAPHLMAGVNDLSDHDLGYGYQWWTLDNETGDFTGIGIYNQFVYVSPRSGVVIVKLSCNRYYASEDSPRAYREMETFALFSKIIESLSSDAESAL